MHLNFEVNLLRTKCGVLKYFSQGKGLSSHFYGFLTWYFFMLLLSGIQLKDAAIIMYSYC